MKKRTLTLAIIATLAFSLGGAGMAFADNASDSATLNLTGNVPSLVRIGFLNGDTSEQTLDFGDLTDPEERNINVRYLANVSFGIDVTSKGNGSLTRTDGSVADFLNEVPYELEWGGSTVDFTSGSANLVEDGSRGATTKTLTVKVDALNLDDLDLGSDTGDIWAEGDYEDELTFTITANE